MAFLHQTTALLLVLLSVVSLTTQNVVTPFISPFASAHNPCGDIRNGEFVCSDCATLAFCIQEAGAWNTIEIGYCDTSRNFYCDEEARACVLKRTCNAPKVGLEFECQNPGTYPDPYNCKYYHVCNDRNEHTLQYCASGSGYSVDAHNCSLRTTSTDCKRQQYECNKPGDMGAWPGDANIYYVCYIKQQDGNLVIYPRLYRCDENNEFDGTKCVRVSDEPSAEERTESNNNAACTGSEWRPDSHDCRVYYICKNGQLQRNTCQSNAHYDMSKKSCVLGSC